MWKCVCLNLYVNRIGIDWDKLPETEPPQILPYLPAKSKDDQALTSDYNVIQLYYVYVIKYVCTYMPYTFVHTSIHRYTMYTHMYIHTYIYTYIRTYVCTYVRTRDATIYRYIAISWYIKPTVSAQFKLYQYIEYRHILNIVCDIMHVLTLILHNTVRVLYYDWCCNWLWLML